MSFDAYLLLAAAVSQLILTVAGTWLALRPPKPEHHWRVIAMFAVVGGVGCAAIVWSGIRANSDQGNVSSGITTIQSGQQQGFRTIQRQIQAIPVPSKPAPTPFPLLPKQHPQVVVSRVEMVPESDGDVGFRLHYTNRGPVKGYTPAFSAYRLISEPITQAQVDENMAAMRKLAFDSPPQKLEEVDSGEDFWRPLWLIPKSDWDDISGHKKELYIFVVMTSRDDALPRGAYWVSEWASVQDGPDEIYEVIRKKTYTHLSKSP